MAAQGEAIHHIINSFNYDVDIQLIVKHYF